MLIGRSFVVAFDKLPDEKKNAFAAHGKGTM